MINKIKKDLPLSSPFFPSPPLSSKGGFTLIEILVAVTIFVGVVVIGVGAFTAQTSTQRKFNIIRTVSGSLRQSMEQISREARQANGKFKYQEPGQPAQIYQGYILLEDNGKVVDDFTTKASILVLSYKNSQDKNIVKIYKSRESKLMVKEIERDENDLFGLPVINTDGPLNYRFEPLSDSEVNVADLKFQGQRPEDPSSLQRPYLEISAAFESIKPLNRNGPYKEDYNSTVTWDVHEN